MIEPIDRVAAWPYARFHCLPDRQMRERWFSGYYDDDRDAGAAIRSFAEHREAEAARTEKHRNDMADKITDLRTEVAALKRRISEATDA